MWVAHFNAMEFAAICFLKDYFNLDRKLTSVEFNFRLVQLASQKFILC